MNRKQKIFLVLASMLGLVILTAGIGFAHKKMVGGYKLDYPPGVYGKDGWPDDPNKMITLTILEPKEGEVLKDGKQVTVKFKLENYHLMEGGNHIHCMVDNNPYVSLFDENKPLIFENLPPGTHVIRAFPSRPWHLAWKNPEAFAVVTFHVQKKDPKLPLDYKKPYITYSRPKGVYEGEAGKVVMLDFWLAGAKLSPGGYHVRYTLDGKEAYLYDWKPVWWKGLAPGDHKVVLEFLDKNGKLVENGWSKTERVFTVK